MKMLCGQVSEEEGGGKGGESVGGGVVRPHLSRPTDVIVFRIETCYDLYTEVKHKNTVHQNIKNCKLCG